LAREAFDEVRSTSSEDAAAQAANLYSNMAELPLVGMPASENDGQLAYEAARTLFALASGIPEDVANSQELLNTLSMLFDLTSSCATKKRPNFGLFLYRWQSLNIGEHCPKNPCGRIR
jgi:hypothetical protein